MSSCQFKFGHPLLGHPVPKTDGVEEEELHPTVSVVLNGFDPIDSHQWDKAMGVVEEHTPGLTVVERWRFLGE